MSYGTPIAVLGNSSIYCLKCGAVQFFGELPDNIGSEEKLELVKRADKGQVVDTLGEECSVVREGQNQDFLEDSSCELCHCDLEDLCEDYGRPHCANCGEKHDGTTYPLCPTCDNVDIEQDY